MTDKAELPYEDDLARTHSAGCYFWRGHHNCAVAKIDSQAAEIERQAALIRDYGRELAAVWQLDEVRHLEARIAQLLANAEVLANTKASLHVERDAQATEIERLAQKLRVEGNCNRQLERQIAERNAEIERLRALMSSYYKDTPAIWAANNQLLADNATLLADAERYRDALDNLEVQASSHVVPYWICVPGVEWKAIFDAIANEVKPT